MLADLSLARRVAWIWIVRRRRLLLLRHAARHRRHLTRTAARWGRLCQLLVGGLPLRGMAARTRSTTGRSIIVSDSIVGEAWVLYFMVTHVLLVLTAPLALLRMFQVSPYGCLPAGSHSGTRLRLAWRDAMGSCWRSQHRPCYQCVRRAKRTWTAQSSAADYAL